MLLGLGLGLIPVFSRLASVRVGLLFPVVFLFAVIGAYAYHQSLFDVGLAFAFAGIGYLVIKLEIPRTTFLVGFILGPLLEDNFRRAMQLSDGSYGIFLESALRSEEHTSELQSLMRISYAVFCLKKKKHITK